jgi:DNA-binding CsgD family transcriptional regulator
MSGRGVASSARILAAERREQAWELKKRGYSYRQIAEKLATSKSTAERDIKRVLDELNARTLETAAEARALDLARLDELLVAWFDTALRERERPTGGEAAEGEASDDLVAVWFAKAARREEAAGEPQTALDAIDWSTLTPMDLLEAVFKQAMLSKQATDIVFKVLEQRAKLLGLYRQEVALTTPAPLQVAADLSGLDEESLDAIIRNLSAAFGAGAD